MSKLMPLTRRTAVLLGAGLLAFSACSDSETTTGLNPEGPPMIRQVLMTERIESTNAMGNLVVRVLQNQLAFGDHPSVAPEDDDRMVTNAVAGPNDNQRFRIVIDELLLGNNLEEIACADGSWSRVPVGATPDDLANCAGGDQSKCTGPMAVCVGASGPVGILDDDEDTAVDDTRLIDGLITLECDGTAIPLDMTRSFYQPSGNQQVPASSGLNGLGPALVMFPQAGLRTGASCTFTLDATVVDKDNNRVCAPPGGDVTKPCPGDGDISAVSFGVEPMRLKGSVPANNQTDVGLTTPGMSDAQMLLQFNVGVDVASMANAFEVRANGTLVTGLTPMRSVDDPINVTIAFPGGYAPLTDYEVTILGGTLKDEFGGTFPADHVFTFTTRAATPMVDAGVPDADTSPDAI